MYVGAIDHRFDWDSVVLMAEGNPDVGVSVFGPAGDVAARALPGNVSVRGPVSYAEAPAVLRRARVGIMPFTQSAMNQGRSPMKFYEYLAAGLNVVTTLHLTPTQRGAPGVWSVRDDQVDGEALRRAHRAPVNDSGVEVARAMDWSGRARRLGTFLEELRSPAAATARDDVRPRGGR